ncbi:FAD-dependent oxidoreductase [Acidisoma cladoniae]|jgi:dimethylamine/trimethylamine dehydrogenase|uniref:oxidoreductase n=1 Tax=Acidisoma cladoniae TaxID=3040935 RepID=UPI00254DAB52|nr:FAD-dependent oxidoreductase [Acidisoma sp. PAMC 29798]
MSRDPRYDVLFEPVKIGPVTAKNRFFQVPHCNGMGYRDPSALATMRAVKAEGGWGVVCTEQAEIHPSAEITPFIELRVWDDQDLPMLSRMANSVHEYGALAGLQLCHNGMNAPNLYSREIPMGPAHLPVASIFNDPVQARAMDKTDIADLRRWHRDAARRAKQADYDIVYVYAGKLFGGPMFFLSRRYNTRTDEYGGSLENRARLLRELISDVRDTVGDRCAVACRISMDELIGEEGFHAAEARDVIAHMAELPDLWDLTLSSWDNDSQTSRFAEEGYQEPYVLGVKQLTTKPVVGVGRFTSPDTMVRMVRQGVLDFIGAARPSIADPFLPKKIEEGRLEDIRECIGCNICVAGDHTASIIRCTQNPSMGEEWRRGWHPERIARRASDETVLVVGSGPTGLEAAMMLGRRGYEVALAERGTVLGGRVAREKLLPGLSAWGRVADYRLGQIAAMPNVTLYPGSDLTADDVLSMGFGHVAIATGSRWRRDTVSRNVVTPMPIHPAADVLTPDDLMEGLRPNGRSVLIYDDDHYVMANVLAELLVREGYAVSFAMPTPDVANWTRNTMEQHRIQTRLIEIGVTIIPQRVIRAIGAETATLACIFTGREETIEAQSVLLVTSRLPERQLFDDLQHRADDWSSAGIRSVTLLGDALAPGTIAAATWSGRRFAEELDAPRSDAPVRFKREVAELLPFDVRAIIDATLPQAPR